MRRLLQSVFLAAALVGANGTRPPYEGEVRGHLRILIVEYTVVAPCIVEANYPVNPQGRHWTVRAGATINWRYNVNQRVAAVSMPHSRRFPHWGFVTNRRCIGKSVQQAGSYAVFHNGAWVRHRVTFPAGRRVPKRRLIGRSQYRPYWVAVDWLPRRSGVQAGSVTLGDNATLRDAPDGFVTGNLYEGWTVRITGERRLVRRERSRVMTKIYVPELRRYGWAELSR